MTAAATGTSRGLNVRTSAVQSRCNRNRQPRASNAHPYTAVCTRRCGLTMQSESQTSCAPCHSSCTSPCTRFGNNQRTRNNNWRRMCTPMLGDPRATQCRSAPTFIAQTEPLLCAQPARVAAPACATCACTASRNCRNTKPERATQHVQELRHHGCIQCIAIARRECHNCSVVFRRLRISTGYSQPITAALSARCKGPIHANSTPIPLQTHGNR